MNEPLTQAGHQANPPNAFAKSYTHRAYVTCDNCSGDRSFQIVRDGGLVGVVTCPSCQGAGKVEVGCGGIAELDLNYGQAYCISEQTFVPAREVSLSQAG